jgi:uncharacterized membrane protein YdjX (TVP38/TMEM64 family)
MNTLSATLHRLGEHRRELLGLLLVALVGVAMLVITRQWWDEIAGALQRTHPLIFFTLMCVLPLGGFSITLVYVVAGARFGVPTGLALIAAATAAHLVGSHLIAGTLLRRPVERWIKRRKYRLPNIAHDEPIAFTLLGALVPGVPYAARNYLLAISGVSFRIYFLVCWPVYVVRSGVAIMLGDWADDLSPTRVALLVGIYAFKLSICAWVVRYLYRKHRPKRPLRAPALKRERWA